MKRRNFLKTHHARRYTADRYKNPLFSGSRKVPIKTYIVRGAVIAAVVVGVPWLIMTLPWFYINEVHVDGSVTLSPSLIQEFSWNQLNEKRWDVVPQNHIWLLNLSLLQRDLKDSFTLADVSVERDGRSIQITVKERITSLIWAQGDRLLFIDQEGMVVRELTEDEVNDTRALIYAEGERTFAIQDEDIFVVFNEGGGDVSQNDRMLTAEAISALSVINENIEQYLIEVESISVEQPLSSWATIRIRGGLSIFVDLAGDAQQQLSNLEVILQEYQGRLGELEYIDLRFDNRVYVK